MMKPTTPGRRSLLIGGVAAIVAGQAGGANARATAEGPWAIELFTSQGCNSCPPADAFLGKLAKRPDIVALSFHVDYWDYIGWKDPFASRETTERQRAYARVLKQRYVYTPEMVVDGIGHDTGRDPGPIDALLAKAQGISPQRATPELSRTSGGPLTITLAAFALQGGPADVTRHLRPAQQYARGERREPGPHAGELQYRAPARGDQPLGRFARELDDCRRPHPAHPGRSGAGAARRPWTCLLYTSDAADE